MKYKVISKYAHMYEDESLKMTRYSLVVENKGLRFVDVSVETYAQAKPGLDVMLPILPATPFFVDTKESSVDRQPPDIL